jgi:hypothetical protein
MDSVDYPSTVYLPQSGNTTQTALLGESVFNLGVYHAGLNQPKSLSVTLGIDQAAAASFIAQNTDYEILPASYYSLPQATVSLGKGEERAYFPIQLKNIDIGFTNKKYFLPISITSVDPEVTISDSEKLAILQFTRFRNVYEAKYKAYGQTVQSGTTDTNLAKIDEVITSISVDANTIQVKGAIAGMNLLLKVQNGQVQITGAAGSEAFNIANTSGKASVYTGDFSDVYQCNTGTYTLYYTYTASGQTMDASVELKFWL